MRRSEPQPRLLTAAEAQAIHDAAEARGAWLVWFVATSGPARSGGVTARGWVATHGGGEPVGVLAADTLDALRAMLPAGLTRQEPTAAHGPDVREVWD